MKPFRIFLVVLLFVVTLMMAQPSWADQISEDSPDYPKVVKALDSLLKAKDNPEPSGYSAEELQQKIADLQLQKETLENSEDWAQCSNETGKLLAIYARKPENATQNKIYYLGSGETTDEDWDCEAIYLPNDAKVAGLDLPGGVPALLRLIDGTQLVAKTDPVTGEIVLDVPKALIELLKADQVNWQVPNLAQADIDVQAANAPTN